jgi:hypothetical protein
MLAKQLLYCLSHNSSHLVIFGLTICIVLTFQNIHIVGIIKCVVCSDWPFSLSNMHASFFRFFSWLDNSFLPTFCLSFLQYLGLNSGNCTFEEDAPLLEPRAQPMSSCLFISKQHSLSGSATVYLPN